MRHALTRAATLTLLVLALAVPRVALAQGPRPFLRVVLVAGGEPPWFDGFARHLQSELALRGIDVAVVRSANADRGGKGVPQRADAELVVEAPSALRPVLRFSVTPGEGPPPENLSNRVRQVNLTGIPSDGWALALAASADELMRSNWPRAVPSAAPATAETQVAPAAKEPSASGAPEDIARSGEAAARGDDSKPKARAEPLPSAEATASTESDPAATADPGAAASSSSTAWAQGGSRFSIGAAAAGEAFAGRQMQLGPDLRLQLRALSRLELGARAGWRLVAPRDATNGAVEGSAIVVGGALNLLVVAGSRASLWVAGRADVVRVAYSGKPRDASVTDGATRNAVGFMLAAGPLARFAITRSVSLEGEVLAGASPVATTATDDSRAVISTNGAAIMASMGLSLGL
jgi:hypothetical protein